MSVLGAIEQALRAALAELDDRVNNRIKDLETRMAALEAVVNAIPAPGKTTLGTTARAGTARGTGKANP